jgi:hypothetical protein
MKLRLRRRWDGQRCVIGELLVNDELECFTLEDVRRPGKPKVPRETCFPEGVYNVSMTMSPRFGEVMPLVWNVKTDDGRLIIELDGKRFEGVRMHWGNVDTDTDACVLVGETRMRDSILSSRPAYARLRHKLATAPDYFASGVAVKAKLEVTYEPNSVC